MIGVSVLFISSLFYGCRLCVWQRKRETAESAVSGPLESVCEPGDQPEDEAADVTEAGQTTQDGRRQLNIDRLLSLDQAILQSVDQCGMCCRPTAVLAVHNTSRLQMGIIPLPLVGVSFPPPWIVSIFQKRRRISTETFNASCCADLISVIKI